MKISPARTAAFDILLRIDRERAFSSILLANLGDTLSAADRGLSHELVLGTLRRQIYLDRIIDVLSVSKKQDIEVRIALRLALYQIIFLTKIPHYSAINESVNLVQRAKKTSAKGFVNAILRRASSKSIQLAFADEIDRISVEASHPRWLIEKWSDEFGIDETKRLAEANNEIPSIAFRLIGAPNGDVRALVESSTRSAHVEGCYIAPDRNPALYKLAETGAIYIQDEASQMVAHAVPLPISGRILDVCAAPGGKTGIIAQLGRARSAVVTAGELHWSRLLSLRDNCRRQGVNISIIQLDAANAVPFRESAFDSVLVDVPCSGTGTLRNNPEIRYSLDRADLVALSVKQLSIVSNASKLVKHGGTLVYSTCSMEIEENERVCTEFMVKYPGFKIVKPSVPEVFLTNSGFARTFPHRHDMDGFFLAVFRRNDNFAE